MKKRYFLLFFLVLFAVIFWVIVRHSVKQVQPIATFPSEAALVPDQPKAQKDDLITVDMPLPGSQVSSPLIIKGQARGSWFFEGSFPITLTDWDGVVIAQGHATAQGDWMTDDYVPFTASLDYALPAGTPYTRGFLILKKDNPSGDAKLDDSLEIMINL